MIDTYAVVAIHNPNYKTNVEIILCKTTGEVSAVKEMAKKHPANANLFYVNTRTVVLEGQDIIARLEWPEVTKSDIKISYYEEYRSAWLKTETETRELIHQRHPDLGGPHD